MDFDRSKHNVIKYLPTNNDENIWGMSISGIGFQSIDPKGSYPLKGHPIGYTFNPDRGRIIDEFALVYIVKGEGTFASINCFEKKIFLLQLSKKKIARGPLIPRVLAIFVSL